MRIVYLLPGGLFNPGGMERVITIKANYLADVLGYEVFIVTTEQMGQAVFYPLSTRVHLCHLDIHISKNFGKENYIRKLISRFFKIKEYKRKVSGLLKEIHPDITITTLGGLDIEFINDLKDGSIKVGELHFQKTFRRIQTRKMHRSFFPRLVGEIITAGFIRNCKKLKRLVVLTEEEKSFWDDARNIVVISNPLSFISEKNSTTKNKQAIAVGRLVYEKGFDMLIEAWKIVAGKHPDWKLDIFGNGIQKNALLQLIAENGLEDQVKIHEPVKEIQNVYPDYSMSILSSRYMEALPMVLLESMVCGVSLVAFDAPCGPKDVIEDGKNGFLVKTGDIAALAEKIVRLIESPDLRKTMGNTAKEMSMNYQVEKIMSRWDQLFKELMNEKDSNIGN
ncbi:MAG: glycosyltransferase family 4 protein [Dysgonamonadaceae bacterium]|jgi:glycosyltransferase involved in cell wall biosynthesis|nr:glycosyltransferase family 4 protein [Dysgonamonadaceae bacterium]